MDSFPIWPYIRNNLTVLIFLVVATAGMLAVYRYFSPLEDATIQAVAAAGEGVSLSAPISKPVSGRVVRQRFAQSEPPLKIALVVGHRGSDSGAVCDDGLTELSITTTIAEKAVLLLAEQEVEVLLFDEFDVRLTNFEGTMLVSIHADSCGVFCGHHHRL